MSKVDNLKILRENNIPIPSFVSVDETFISQASEELLTFLDRFDSNKSFAVRSSANVEDSAYSSYAGIFESYLNIRKHDIHSYILKCLGSKQSEKLTAYERHMSETCGISMQVIVQEMIDSDISGVMFCQNPISAEKYYLIECGWGLGDGIVSGKVSPDQIKYDFNNKNILTYNVSFQEEMIKPNPYRSGVLQLKVPLLDQSKRKISFPQIETLVSCGEKVSRLLNYAADIEFCFAQNHLYILQARPITT